MADYKHTSIRLPLNLWSRVKDLSAHIKKVTGKDVGLSALIIEALYFYLSLLQIDNYER